MAIRKINTRSPYYLTVKEEYVAPEPIVPEEGDPDPIVPEDPTDPINPPPTQTTQNLTYQCGSTQTLNGFVGTTIFTKDYSYLLADLETAYTVSGTPSKLTFSYNGTSSSTGYIGSDSYDDQLIAAGVNPLDINTGSQAVVTGIMQEQKDLESPTTVTLTVHSPLGGAYVQLQNSCDVIPVTPEGTEVYVMNVVSKKVSGTSNAYQEDAYMNGVKIQTTVNQTYPLYVDSPVISYKNEVYQFSYVFMNVDNWRQSADLPTLNNVINQLITPEPIAGFNYGYLELSNININAMNILRITNSDGNLLKQYDIRFYKGFANSETNAIENLCVVEDFAKDYGFAVGTLPYTEQYPVIKNICK